MLELQCLMEHKRERFFFHKEAVLVERLPRSKAFFFFQMDYISDEGDSIMSV